MIRFDIQFKHPVTKATEYRTYQTEDNGENLYTGRIVVHKISTEKGFNSLKRFKSYVRSHIKEANGFWKNWNKGIKWFPVGDSMDRMKR